MGPRNIALYPAGAHEYQSGGRDGLEWPLTLAEIHGHVPAQVDEELASHYEQRDIFFRAVIPFHRAKWEKLRKHDWALFYKEEFYYATATITFKWHLNELAKSIFGDNRTPKGEIWDLFCFFEPPREINISKEEINDAGGYDSDRPLYGFTVIYDPVKVKRVVELIDSA